MNRFGRKTLGIFLILMLIFNVMISTVFVAEAETDEEEITEDLVDQPLTDEKDEENEDFVNVKNSSIEFMETIADELKAYIENLNNLTDAEKTEFQQQCDGVLADVIAAIWEASTKEELATLIIDGYNGMYAVANYAWAHGFDKQTSGLELNEFDALIDEYADRLSYLSEEELAVIRRQLEEAASVANVAINTLMETYPDISREEFLEEAISIGDVFRAEVDKAVQQVFLTNAMNRLNAVADEVTYNEDSDEYLATVDQILAEAEEALLAEDFDSDAVAVLYATLENIVDTYEAKLRNTELEYVKNDCIAYIESVADFYKDKFEILDYLSDAEIAAYQQQIDDILADVVAAIREAGTVDEAYDLELEGYWEMAPVAYHAFALVFDRFTDHGALDDFDDLIAGYTDQLSYLSEGELATIRGQLEESAKTANVSMKVLVETFDVYTFFDDYISLFDAFLDEFDNAVWQAFQTNAQNRLDAVAKETKDAISALENRYGVDLSEYIAAVDQKLADGSESLLAVTPSEYLYDSESEESGYDTDTVAAVYNEMKDIVDTYEAEIRDVLAKIDLGGSKKPNDTPQTGDSTNLPLYVTLMSLSGCGLIVMMKRYRFGVHGQRR